MRQPFHPRVATIGRAAALTALLATAAAQADTTSGGVNWLDTLTYTKPTFIPLSVPDESSVANKYYVDMSSGSGSTCSQAAPCSSIEAVSGKPGTNGGPAYIYVRGNGRLNLTGSTLAGSAGNEIVVKPWPGSSTPAVMTASGGCNVSDANTISGSNTHHVIFDGGPDMLLRFNGSGCTSNQNGYTVVVRSNDITLYRVRIDAKGSGGPALGPGTGSGTHTSNFKFINSELYGATRYYGVYTGGGTGCAAGDTSHTNLEFRNSIFRQIDGRGIQIEPRADSSGVIVDGNAFHGVGYNSSGTSSISGAVQVANACGGTTNGIVVSNNLMWDLGGGGVLVFVSPSSASAFRVINNTIYDYGRATPISLNSHAITCYSDGCKAEVRNNIILAPRNSGVNPLNRDSGLTTGDNLCESGSRCGSGAASGTASTAFLSTSPTSNSFLFPVGAALKSAVLQTGVQTDYLGKARISSSVDTGAMESSSAVVRSMPPTNLTVN